jgi:hypothetical protein
MVRTVKGQIIADRVAICGNPSDKHNPYNNVKCEMNENGTIATRDGDVIGVCIGDHLKYGDIPSNGWFWYDGDEYGFRAGAWNADCVDTRHLYWDFKRADEGALLANVPSGVANVIIKYEPGEYMDISVIDAESGEEICGYEVNCDLEQHWNNALDYGDFDKEDGDEEDGWAYYRSLGFHDAEGVERTKESVLRKRRMAARRRALLEANRRRRSRYSRFY